MNSVPFQIRLILTALGREDGQDLVEYALIIAMMAFAGIAGMNTLASSINSMLSSMSASITAS